MRISLYNAIVLRTTMLAHGWYTQNFLPNYCKHILDIGALSQTQLRLKCLPFVAKGVFTLWRKSL